MATNDFLSFAGDPAANVMLQTDYAATGFTPRLLGFQTGTALSIQLNKVWRQASLISAMIGQFPVNTLGVDMKDDGSASGQAALLTNFTNAVAQVGGAGLAGKYLPLTGGTLTGDLVLDGPTNQLTINAPTGQHAIALLNRNPGLVARWEALSNNVGRWTVDFADATPETGNNIGSNFVITRLADNGSYLDAPFWISRATGVAQFSHPPQVNGGPLPYLPISGGNLTGVLTLPLPGITYTGTSGHWIAFDWDGSFIRGWVDGGGYLAELASTSWVNGVVGNYVSKGGDIIYNWFEMDCNATVDGSLWCRSTVYFSNLGDFANFTGGNWRYRQWAGNWYDAWDGGSGTRLWANGPTGTNMTLDPYCNLSISGTLHVYGGRIACGEYGSISVYSPQTAQGMWAGSDGLWFGWNDTNATPQNGLLRLGNDGVLSNWAGIVCYNWIQCSQFFSAGGSGYFGQRLDVNGARIACHGPASVSSVANGGFGMGMMNGYYFGGCLVFGQCSEWGDPYGYSAFANSNGTFAAGGFYSWSGRNRKQNIAPAPNIDSLAALCRIKTYSYDLIEHDLHTEVGLIADEVREILPDCVEAFEELEIGIGIMPMLAHIIRAIGQINARLDAR